MVSGDVWGLGNGDGDGDGGGGREGVGGSIPTHNLSVHLAFPQRQRHGVVRDLLLNHTGLKVRTLGLEEIPAEWRTERISSEIA